MASPSSETLPYLGYSALNNKCAQVFSNIYLYLPLKSIYNISSAGMESFFEIYEILRLFNQFTEGIYFGDKIYFFEKYLNIIQNCTENITKENIPTLAKTNSGYVEKPQTPHEMLLNSTILLKLSSYVKETVAILQYIVDNRDILTNDIANINDKIRDRMQYDYRINKIQKNMLFFTEMKALSLSKDKLIEYGKKAAKIYTNLYGDVFSVSFIDHLACCQIIKSILNGKIKFPKFDCLNFYDRRTQNDIFYELYGRVSQERQSLSSMLKHDKFTTEDCMLIERLIDTQKYCLFGIDIFSVYQEILNVLEVLDYALTTDKEDWATSPYKHLKAGGAILAEWGKVIYELEDFFENTLNIDVDYI